MRQRRQPLHLLEVGLLWPPEAFLQRKLTGLAAAGLRVSVAPSRVDDPSFRLPGVSLLDPSRPGLIGRLGAACALVIGSPVRALRLARAVIAAPSWVRRRHGGRRGLLAKYLPLARLRPDAVQFESNVTAVDHLPLFEIWRCPVLTSCRGSDLAVYPHVPTQAGYVAQLPEVMRRAAAVHCVSDSLRSEAVAFGLNPARAWVIRPAVDAGEFRPRDGAEEFCPPDGHPGGGDKLRILMIGGMRWEKGHEYALAAVRSLLDSGLGVRLELIGAAPEGARAVPPEEQRLRHAIVELGLQEHVALRPRASTGEIVRRLGHADVLLHPSLSEGIPNVVLEAMACGVPIVATRCGGVSEAVSDGIEGILVAPREPEALADALRKLWRQPDLREDMGAAGRRRVCERFSVAEQLQEFVTMYQAVAS